jgi:hypothetical protein
MPLPRIPDETAEPQTLGDILAWRSAMVDALIDQRRSVQRAIQLQHPVLARFVGMTEAEVEEYYDAQRRELDRLTVLNLVASAEGTIKIDYFRRVRGKLDDPLALAYRQWYKTLSANKQLRPDFDEGGILDVLKQTGVMNNYVIGAYRQCLRARHWLGHGRYWAKPVEVDSLDPDDVHNRAEALLQALPP